MAARKSNLIARIGGLALVVVVIVLLLMRQPARPELPSEPAVRPAKTLVTQSLAAATSRRYPGVVRASELVELSFRVGGPLVELPIRRGQEIEAGAVVARIDPRDFETRLARITSQLEEARAQLEAMKTGAREEVIRRLEAQVSATKSELANAEVELKRIQGLFDEQVVSESELDQAKLRVDVASQRVAAAEEELRQGRAGARAEDIQAQEARVRGLDAQRKEASDALADTTLVAPFSGVVARQNVENFQTVQPNESIISLQNVDEIEIVADIPESLLAILRREDVQGLFVRFEATGEREWPVDFKEAEAQADRLTQTYAITVTMPAPEDVRILPGMAATLRIAFDPAARGGGGIPVPVEALYADPEGASHVWVVVEGEPLKVTARAVEAGDVLGGTVLVTKGLEAGEEIVTAGVHFLEEGMQIRRYEPGR